MKKAQNEQLTVVDQNVADRRMALQKTKQLHKQLDEMKPNAVFNSVVKRPTEDSIDVEKKRMMLNTIQSTQLKTGTMVIAKAPVATLRTTVVDRPGQDDGFYTLKQAAKKDGMFNSTSPRFNYRKEQSLMKEVPGPGSYDSTQEQSFKETGQTSIF